MAATRNRTTLAYLLAPYSVEEFEREFAERAPLHVRRNIAGYYERYFSLAELERVLFGCKLTTDEVRLIKDGTPVRTETYTWLPPDKYRGPVGTPTSIAIDADRVASQIAHGCTLNLNAVDRFSPQAAALGRDLGAFFQCNVGANVYLTPAGNQGFHAHYDTHDTVILQMEGSKRWRVYEPTLQLPLDHQIYTRVGHTTPGPLLFEVDLLPGDLLYLPRGYFHEGKANQELSLHVTYSVSRARWVQVAVEALMRAAETDVRLRTYAGGDSAQIPAILAQALTSERLDAAYAQLGNDFLSLYRNDLDDQLRQVAELENLSEHSNVAKRPSVLHHLEETTTGVRLTFAGKTLTFSASAKAIVNELDSVSSVPVSALLTHDPKALSIVRRLIQEGFAVQCTPDRGHGVSVA